MVAFLIVAATGDVYQSAPVAVTGENVIDDPTAVIRDKQITAGDVKVHLRFTFDAAAESKTWQLFKFRGEEFDPATATPITGLANIYTSGASYDATAYIGGANKPAVGDKLAAVVTTDSKTAASNVVVVEPSPAWADDISVAIDTNAIRTDATTVPVVVNYAPEYEELFEFFCNVTAYTYPGTYTDDEFEARELHETTIAKSIATANRNATRADFEPGSFTMNLFSGASLKAGDRVILKLRLPNAEWWDELEQDADEDYLSFSVPVIDADAVAAPEQLLVYNLGEDTARGAKLRAIAEKLGLPVRDVANSELNETVGYLGGFDGFGPSDEAYAGAGYESELLVMSNVSEATLDRLLKEMKEAGLDIGTKCTTTPTNVAWPVKQLLEDIAEEHEVMSALFSLASAIRTAEGVSELEYGSSPAWQELKDAIAAGKEVLASEEELEPAAYKSAEDAIWAAYKKVTGTSHVDGTAVLTAEPEEGGTFALSVQVQDATTEGLDYIYTWNNGSSAMPLTGVPADKVGDMVVTVGAHDAIGEIKGQLLAPAAPKATAQAQGPKATISWDLLAADTNQPAPESYSVELFDGAQSLGVKTVDANANQVVFDGLEAASYTAKVWGANVAGRGDKATVSLTVTVDKKALEDAIKAAQAAEKGVKTSEKGGKDLADKDKFTTAAQKKALDSAIAAAQKVADDQVATQKQVDDAAAAVEKATDTYKKAIKTASIVALKSATAPNQKYTGKALKPAVAVFDANGKKVAASNYTVSYANSIKTGTATATVKAKANSGYKGSAKATFQIKGWERLYGSSSFDTMEQITKTFGSAKTAVVASNKDFKDSLAAAALAGSLGAPMFTTPAAGLADKTKSELSRMGVTTVYIVGSTASVSGKVESQIKAVKSVKTVKRIGAQTPSATAVAAAKQVKGRSDTVIIATQASFKDALAISPYAYASKSPILYAEANKKLSNATLSYIKSAKFKKAIVVGGPVALPKDVENQLRSAGIAANSITRLAGSNQYKTAQVAAEWATGKLANGTGGNNGLYQYASIRFQPAVKLSAGKLGVARADDNKIGWKDALAGAALCGKNKSVLLLADAKNSVQAESFVKANKNTVGFGYVFGGPKAVPQAAMDKLVNASL